MGVEYWPSKIHERLNRRPFSPELITGTVTVSAAYPVHIEQGARAMNDSCAFTDVDAGMRRTFEEALERQLQYERNYGFVSARIVSYDLLVDERHVDGKKIKDRMAGEEAAHAVEETVKAAAYLASKRHLLGPRQLILSCQGSTIAQYTECAKRVLAHAVPADCFGFGGFCIIGRRQRSMTVDGMTYPKQFVEITRQVAPLIARAGIRESHAFGVTYMPALIGAARELARYGIALSTDSSAVEQKSVKEGWVWDVATGRFTHKLGVYDKNGRRLKWTGPGSEEGDPPPGMWHPNLLAVENIKRAAQSLAAINTEGAPA